jgi:hypothetical protein
VKVSQGLHRDARNPEGHAGTNAGVEHPLRQCRYDAGRNFDMDNTAASTLLSVLRPQTPAIERMPAIVNFKFLPDMARMNRSRVDDWRGGGRS